jgi:hypothetical protein
MFVTVDLKDILKLVFRVVRIVLALVLLFGSIYWIMHGGKEQVISWYMGLWRWAVQMYDAHKVEILSTLGVVCIGAFGLLAIMDSDFF